MAVTLNLNRLNPPIKRHSQNLMICYIQTHLTSKDIQRLKGLEKDLPTKWRAKINRQKAGVAILASDKIDFKATKIQW